MTDTPPPVPTPADALAREIRDVAEFWLYDGDTDQPTNDGYERLLAAADQVGALDAEAYERGRRDFAAYLTRVAEAARAEHSRIFRADTRQSRPKVQR